VCQFVKGTVDGYFQKAMLGIDSQSELTANSIAFLILEVPIINLSPMQHP
jgi:hypothetical protein